MADTVIDPKTTNMVLLVTALKNAHAMEKEAQQIISRQLDRLKNYPKVEDRLRSHLAETNTQMQRLDDVLATVGSESSGFKDLVTGIVGNMAALGHVPMGDEILKNSFANYAFENFEIAAYKSLFTIAEGVGQGSIISVLTPSLKEEQAMAAWLDDNLAEVTQTYMRLRATEGVDASH
ncbi:MAG: ferritin-like domain-containing protein [Caulobacteraceae bacterium]